MTGRRDECVDCGLPCMGSGCPYRNMLVLTCDKCGHEVNELFDLDGEQLCDECLFDELPMCESDNDEMCTCCGQWGRLFYLDEEPMCEECIMDKLRIVDFDE